MEFNAAHGDTSLEKSVINVSVAALFEVFFEWDDTNWLQTEDISSDFFYYELL